MNPYIMFFFWVESSRNFIFPRDVLLLADSSLFVLQKKITTQLEITILQL